MNLALSSLVLCSSSDIITLYKVLFLEYCYACITVEKVNSRRLVLVTNSHLKGTDSFPAAAQGHRGRSSGTLDSVPSVTHCHG